MTGPAAYDEARADGPAAPPTSQQLAFRLAARARSYLPPELGCSAALRTGAWTSEPARGAGGYRAGHTTGMPLLPPWANRLRLPTGRRVEIDPSPGPGHLPGGLPIHGTLTAAPGWRVEAHLADAIPGAPAVPLRAFGSDPARLASFPFPHDLVVFALLS